MRLGWAAMLCHVYELNVRLGWAAMLCHVYELNVRLGWGAMLCHVYEMRRETRLGCHAVPRVRAET